MVFELAFSFCNWFQSTKDRIVHATHPAVI